jgi:hypothetical protein
MAKQNAQIPIRPYQQAISISNVKWYNILSEFFEAAGLHETIRGFEADLLVLSRAQHERLPKALERLAEGVRSVYDG